MNQNYRYDTGRARADSWGWGFLKALHPEDRDRYPAQRQQAVSKGQPYEIKYRLLGADGSYHWLLEQAIPTLEEDGLVQDWMVTCTPVRGAGGAGGDGEQGSS